MSKKKKVLIIGGGGIFGIIPITYLKSVGITDIRNDVDFISGTSIGGIISLFLAQGKSIDELDQAFKESVGNIFSSSFWRKFNFNCSKYPASNIEPFLQKYLEGEFGDLSIPTIIPVLNFKKEKPKIFDNIVKDDDYKYKLWELGRMTSAAPTYFPPYGDFIGLDGGIIENIPVLTTLCAITSKTNLKFSDLDVLVLGTGRTGIKEKNLSDVSSYNAINWLNNLLIPFVTKSNEITSDYWAKQLDLNSYVYFNPVYIEGDMDDSDQVESGHLERDCSIWIEEFKQIWEEFISK